MIYLTRTGVGTADHAGIVRDTNGSGLLPVQADTDGTTFKVMGRVSPDAPWAELKAAGAIDFIEAVVRVPYIRLEVTAGAGTVNLWIGEQ